MAAPSLSVCLITYNHKKYIREAIDSVLMQIVNFTWELIVADDFSTDGTREALLEYKEKYPEFINLILQEKNVGPAQNWKDLITAPKSKYIAYFEGDDYWTEPLKLQKQVEFLEANPSFSMCFHNALIMEDDKLTNKQFLPPMDKSVFDTEDTLYPFRSFAPTASIVFRNNLLTHYPDWFYSCSLGDRMLFTMLSKHGQIKYLDFNGSVRRIQPGSITLTFTKLSIALNRKIFYKNMPSYIGKEYKPLCDRYLKYFYGLSIQCYFRNQSSNCSDPISILKGLRYLLSPTYLSLLKVTSIKDDKGFIKLTYYMLRIIISKLKVKLLSHYQP